MPGHAAAHSRAPDALPGYAGNHELTSSSGERIPTGVIRGENGTDPQRAAAELASASKVVNELAAAKRDRVRQPVEGERGRAIEHEEHVHSRTIQKER